MFCSYCGARLAANAAVCSACGEATAFNQVTQLGTAGTGLGTNADVTRLGTSADSTRLGSSADAMTALGGGTSPSGQFAHRSSAVATQTPPGVPVMPGSPLAPGASFGSRYHIIRLLGMGGMGAVYQAWDDELGVAVALKVIRPEITSDPAAARDLERRFKRELLLARQVTHKNVVRIHDLGEIDGIKYITMPYIQGSDLGSILSKEGKLSVPRAVAFAKQVVGGLVAAHEAGVVHRDLKPANIMIDADDQAVIMDFGIARSVSGGGATVAGAVVGTLEYMAPEQAMAQPIDQRADVYAFGLILYDMVLGQRQSTRAESAVAELMARVQNPMPPARSVDPSIPEPLERLIDKCTQPDPAMRYQTSAQLAQDLELLDGAGRPVSGTAGFSAPPIARTSTQAIELPKGRSVPLKAVLVAVAVLVLAAGGWLLRDRFASGGGTPATKPVALAVIPFRNATGDASLDWLGPSLADMVSDSIGQSARLRLVRSERVAPLLRDLRIGPNTEVDGITIKSVADFTNAENVIAGRFVKLGEQIRIEALLYGAGGEPTPITESAAGESDILRAAQTMALAIQQKLSLSDSEIRDLQATAFKPSSQSVHALRYYSEGIQFGAVGEHLKAAKSFEESTKADPKFALAFSGLAQSLALTGRSSDAESASRTAVSLSENLPQQERELIAAAHARILNDLDKAIESYGRLVERRPTDVHLRFDLAALLERNGALDRARDEYAKVLEADPKYIPALYAAGRVAIRRGDNNGALEPLNRAHTLSIQLNHQESKANVLQALGIAYRNLGRLDEALRHFEQSLEIKRQINDKRGEAASLNEMATIYSSQGRIDEAVDGYKKSVEIRAKLGDRGGQGLVLLNLGGLYLDRARYDDALGAFKEALQIYRDLGDAPRQALCLSNIGNLFFARAQYDEALTYLERALELREKLGVPANVAESLVALGNLSARLGDYDRAQTRYLRAGELSRKAADRRGIAMASYGMGVLLEHQGRYGAAMDATAEAVKTYRDLEERSYWLAEGLSGHGAALSLAGRADEADKSLAEALTLARELKNDALVGQALNFQGDNAYYRGDLRTARGLYQQALEASKRTQNTYLILRSSLNLAKAAVEEGQSAAALPELKKLIPEADRLGVKQLSAEAKLFQGVALNATKKAADARVTLDDALVTAERLGARALLARIHHAIGESLRLSGKESEAESHYAKARQSLDEIRKDARTDAVLARHDLRELKQASPR